MASTGFVTEDCSGLQRSAYKQDESRRIRVLSWNIDGLDKHLLEKRTEEICDIIKTVDPHVVLLQEVILETFAILKQKCPGYRIIPGDVLGYFVAIMLKMDDTEFLNKSIIPYPFSRMDRGLLTVRCRIKGVPLVFMTSHLESMLQFSGLRMIQLDVCFQLMKIKPAGFTVVFGGDMNIRDSEVEKLGGVPNGICDVWEFMGSDSKCQFTWDLLLNTNKHSHKRRNGNKPRLRFDRIYFRDSDPPQITPVYFELVGKEKLRAYDVFPSDHFGLLTHFDIKDRMSD